MTLNPSHCFVHSYHTLKRSLFIIKYCCLRILHSSTSLFYLIGIPSSGELISFLDALLSFVFLYGMYINKSAFFVGFLLHIFHSSLFKSYSPVGGLGVRCSISFNAVHLKLREHFTRLFLPLERWTTIMKKRFQLV